MEDGILTAPAPYSAPDAYYSINSARMSGIEVIKGSSQIKFGPQTTGGVVNYISTPVPTQETFFLNQQFGSDNEVRSHLYYGDVIELESGKLSYLLEGYYRENDGFRDIQNSSKNTGINEQVEPQLKLRWEPNTAEYQYLEFKIGYSDLEANESYVGLNDADFKDNPHDRYWGTQWDQMNAQQTRTYLKHYIEFNNDTSLNTAIYYNKFHRNWYKLNKVGTGADRKSINKEGLNDPAYLAVLNGTAAGNLDVKANNRDYYSYGIQTELVHNFETGDIGHELTLGSRFNTDKIRRKQWEDRYNTDGSFGLTSIDREFLGPDDAGDRLQKTYATAFYIQDQMEITDNLTLTAGVRAEYISFHHNRYDKNRKGEAQHLPWSGGVGFNYVINDNLSLFGGAHRGISTPSPRSNIDSDIGFERSNAYELGLRYTNVEKAFSAEAVLFRTDFNNLIVLENQATGNENAGNAGEVCSQGVELSANWDAGIYNNWEVSNPWFISGTYTNAEFVGNNADSDDDESIFFGAEDGNELPYIPEFQFSIGTGLVFDKFGTFITASYQDSTWTTGSNDESSTNSRIGKVDSRFVADFASYYDVDKNLKLTFDVQNLFDEEYNISRHPHGSRAGAPRTFLVGLQYKF
jgi:Fe(3+) dicitrate transport protein